METLVEILSSRWLTLVLMLVAWGFTIYLSWELARLRNAFTTYSTRTEGHVEEAWALGVHTGVDLCNLALRQSKDEGKPPEHFSITITDPPLSDPSVTVTPEGDTHA